MKRMLKKREHRIWHYVEGSKVAGPHPDLSGNVTDLWGDVTDLSGNVTDLRGDVTGLWGDVTGLSGNVTDLRGDVTGLSGDVTDLSGDVTDLRGDVTGLSGNVSGLSGDVSGLRGDVDDCEITEAERAAGVDVADLAAERAAQAVEAVSVDRRGQKDGKADKSRRHTPLPWTTSELHAAQFSRSGGKRITGPDGILIATVNGDNPCNDYGEWNTEFILRAVNSYDGLVDACKTTQQVLSVLVVQKLATSTPSPELRKVLVKLRDALKAAEEKK